MSDVDQLEQALDSHGGSDAGTDALPAGFRETLEGLKAAGAGSPRVVAARRLHLEAAANLVDQLDSADNLVVKMQKRRVIRAELNAVKLLDAL